MGNSLRWLIAAVVAIACAVGGVMVASVLAPRVPAVPQTTPVVIAVTTTATAHPSPVPAPVVSPIGIDLTQHSIDDPESIWVVVNKLRPLDPESYQPGDLTSTGIPGGNQVTGETADQLQRMYEAASDAGAAFSVSTAYRSYNFQKGLFAQYVASDGVERAETYSARPGYSEHQTGLAVDLFDPAEGCALKRCFAETDAGQWLSEHAAEFGFIERYPDGATDITGYKWESWHWRYVGVELAEYMRDEKIATLEEVFGLPAAPDYD